MVTFLYFLLVAAGCEVGQSTTPEADAPAAAEDIKMPEDAAKKDTPSDHRVDTEKPIEKVVKTDDQWRKELTTQEYRVLRHKGTERAFSGKYDKHFKPGAYACAACGQILFEAQTKFNSGCGWPAFYAAKAGDRVTLTPDYSHGMIRTEVTCTRCDSHLGHVFDDAPQTPTGQRYCINSVSLDFISAKELAKRQQAKEAERQPPGAEAADATTEESPATDEETSPASEADDNR